jgi:hypothetical protein
LLDQRPRPSQQERRALLRDLHRKHGEPSLDNVPPVVVQLGVPMPFEDLGRVDHFSGGQGMANCFLDQTLTAYLRR